MRSYLWSLLFLILLQSCASTWQEFHNYTKYEYNTQSFPLIDEITTKTLGERLIETYDTQSSLCVKITKDLFDGYIPAREYYPHYSYNSFVRYIGVTGKSFAKAYYLDYDLVHNKLYYVSTGVTDSIILGHQNLTKRIAEIKDFEIFQNLVRVDNTYTFDQTILYLGKAGNIAKFAYREFDKNTARPAFSTEFEIDLSETNILAYQKLRIQIISVNSSSITYKILNYF